jgi:hypothetical protein
MDTGTNLTEDARKKRDSREVVEDNASNVDDDKSKKPRERRQRIHYNNEPVVVKVKHCHNVTKSDKTSGVETATTITTNPTTITSGNDKSVAPTGVLTSESTPTCEGIESRIPKSATTTGTTTTVNLNKTTSIGDDEGSNSNRVCTTNYGSAVDVENALHQVIQVSEGIHEYISNNGTFISFRVGHAGDASALAELIRKSLLLVRNDCSDSSVIESSNSNNKRDNHIGSQNEENQQPADPITTTTTGTAASTTTISSSTTLATTAVNSNEDTTLEVRLADGLGDEDTPPSVFALIVDITTRNDNNNENNSSQNKAKSNNKCNNNKNSNDHKSTSPPPRSISNMAGAALISISIVEQTKILLVEWLDVIIDTIALDNDTMNVLKGIIERRLWLRLCTLCILLFCERIVMQEQQQQPTHTTDNNNNNNMNNNSNRTQ